MPRNIIAFFCLATCFLSLQGADFSDSGYSSGKALNYNSAVDLCAALPLSPIEGIWEYPDDDISLLILADKWRKGKFGVYVIEAVDCRLYPGMKIGEASASADPLQFRLELCSKIKKGLPGTPVNCLAKLSRSAESLIIQAPKLRISLSPSLMLPTLWNKLRLSLRIKTSNPIDKLPEGWRKIYPSYDGNGSSASSCRYL